MFQILRQLRAKTAELLAKNSFSARTGIFRRQTYEVHRFQRRLALTFLVLSAFHTLVCAMVVYQLFGGPQNGADLPAALARLTSLESKAVWLFLNLVLLSICSYSLLYFIVIVATHRVAGPVVVMQKHLGSLLSGHYPKFRPLREHDELKDFFEQFRRLIEEQRAKDDEESQILERLSATVADWRPGSKEQVLASLRALITAKRRAPESAERVPVAPEPGSESAALPARAASR